MGTRQPLASISKPTSTITVQWQIDDEDGDDAASRLTPPGVPSRAVILSERERTPHHRDGNLADRLVHHDANPVLRWMVAKAVPEMDPAGNVKPSRDKSGERIDGVAAWCDALFAWSVAEPPEEEERSDYETDAERMLI